MFFSVSRGLHLLQKSNNYLFLSILQPLFKSKFYFRIELLHYPFWCTSLSPCSLLHFVLYVTGCQDVIKMFKQTIFMIFFYKSNKVCGVAQQLRAPDSSSGISNQQSVASSPRRDTCVLLSKTQNLNASSLGWDVKPLVPFVVYLHVKRNECTISQREGVCPMRVFHILQNIS